MKTKTIAKGKSFGSPARQRDSLVIKSSYLLSRPKSYRENVWGVFIHFYRGLRAKLNISNWNMWQTRLCFEFTATSRMSGKSLWLWYLGQKLTKLTFLAFFQFLISTTIYQKGLKVGGRALSTKIFFYRFLIAKAIRTFWQKLVKKILL